MGRIVSLVLFLVLTLGGGLVVGFTNMPGDWYAGLAKPSFNPPDWLFGPVWSILYVVIGFVGWRAWQANPTGRRMQLWWAQIVLNFLWMPLFFGLQLMMIALLDILLLLAAILGYIAMVWHRDRLSAWLFLPYALWVAFATLLNISLIWLN